MSIKFPSFLPDVVCPYCLKPLKNKDLKMVCNVCGEDVIPNKIEFFFKKVPKCSKSGCSGEGTDLRCRNCNSSLPHDILLYNAYIRFSILGVTGCGKTNFLTTMLYELKNSDSPWVPSYMDEQTRISYEENVRCIYKDKTPPPPNPPGEAPMPQLWRIKNKLKKINNTIPAYSLTIFDGAGEDVVHANELDSISRYIKDSKSLVILIDPLSLPHVAENINEDIRLWSTTADHAEGASATMIDSLANYIRRSCGYDSRKLINRDVAIVFTKIDVVKDDFAEATVMQPSPHIKQKAFVQADADAVIGNAL